MSLVSRCFVYNNGDIWVKTRDLCQFLLQTVFFSLPYPAFSILHYNLLSIIAQHSQWVSIQRWPFSEPSHLPGRGQTISFITNTVFLHSCFKGTMNTDSESFQILYRESSRRRMWFPGVRVLPSKHLLLLSSHAYCGSLRLLMDFMRLAFSATPLSGHAPSGHAPSWCSSTSSAQGLSWGCCR